MLLLIVDFKSQLPFATSNRFHLPESFHIHTFKIWTSITVSDVFHRDHLWHNIIQDNIMVLYIYMRLCSRAYVLKLHRIILLPLLKEKGRKEGKEKRKEGRKGLNAIYVLCALP